MGYRYGLKIRKDFFYHRYRKEKSWKMGKSVTVLSKYTRRGDCIMEGSIKELMRYKVKFKLKEAGN